MARFLGLVVVVGLCGGLAACSSGGGGGSSLVVSGQVSSPGGQPIGLVAGRPLHPGRLRERGHELALEGLLPVPDGTPVELLRLDGAGAPLATLAATATAAGRYAFDLEGLGLVLASDLAVVAGSGAARMRASVVERALDVDPVSEAVLQALLQQGVGLAPFTVEEASDLLASARLLAAAQGLASENDVAATVDLVRQALLADAGIAAFLVAAAGAGQTSSGPGDVGDYFPSGLGDAWGFAAVESIPPFGSNSFRRARRIVEVGADGAFTVEERELRSGGSVVEELLQEHATALVYLGDTDQDPLLDAVTPFDEVRFPLRAGERWVQFDVRDVPAGDLDFDGLPDLADLRAERTVAGFASREVLGETLSACVELETSLRVTLRFSGGAQGVSSLSASEWFAPGRGLVASQSTLEPAPAGPGSREERSDTLDSFQAGVLGRGALPGHVLLDDLTPAHSDTGEPGRPGIGFDGVNYLVVSCRDSSGVVGALVSPGGVLQQEFPIRAGVGFSCSPRPVVSFDGANFLIVYTTTGTPELVGVRVSPTGEVLDPDGFSIAPAGASSSGPSVVFDGLRHLVVWNQSDPGLLDEIYAAFVEPDGTVAPPFVVHSGAGSEHSPALVAGGGQFLVVWVEDAFPSSDLRGARIAADGTVLDPDGFDVATEPEPEASPALSYDGQRYLVVYTREPTPFFTGADVCARRLELDGTPSDPAPIVLTTADDAESPTVAFDGTNHFLAWGALSFGPPATLHAARVSPAGELLDGPAGGGGFALDQTYAFAERLVAPALARGAANLLAAWVVNAEVGGQRKDLAVTQIHPPGR